MLPVWTRLATASPRSWSLVHTLPPSPNSESLAIATASSTPSYGITESTGLRCAQNCLPRREVHQAGALDIIGHEKSRKGTYSNVIVHPPKRHHPSGAGN